ncbi:hypothetical protein F4778DRAFT_334200 [Xylariomycetidae sp. FL2044]|nr:hypothetical protein F4778DRAFT_334200 [Xylariomycetidae sp. FL2044]
MDNAHMRLRYSRSTNALWWRSDDHGPQQLCGMRFAERLHDHVQNVTRPRSDNNFPPPLDVVILTWTLGAVGISGDATVSLTQDHFGELLRVLQIPSQTLRETLHQSGHHSWDTINLGASDRASSSLIATIRSPNLTIATRRPPSPGNEGLENLESYFLALRVPTGPSPAACLIVAPSSQAAKELGEKLSKHRAQVNADPINLLHVFCEHLDEENTHLADQTLGKFEAQRREMLRSCRFAEERTRLGQTKSCRDENVIYKAHGRAMFELNTMYFALMNLKCATAFEVSALRFAGEVMTEYQRLRAAAAATTTTTTTIHNSQPSSRLARRAALPQSFAQRIEYLKTASRLREAKRRGLQTQIGFMTHLLRCSNAQRDTLYTNEISSSSHKMSSQVKNLSVLAAVFIPATFVATIFGTNVLPVSSDSGNITPSRQWWALPVAALGLSLLVFLAMAAWIMANRAAFKETDPEGRCPGAEKSAEEGSVASSTGRLLPARDAGNAVI